MNVSIRPLEFKDLEMLHRWLNQRHLNPFYMQDAISLAEVLEKFEPRISGNHKTKCLVATIDDTPYGYMQWYLNCSYPDYGAAIIEKEAGFSIDYFIGEPEFLGRSLGAEMLNCLVEYVFPVLNEADRIAYIGHDNANLKAIRCTRRAGFKETSNFVEKGKDCTLYSRC